MYVDVRAISLCSLNRVFLFILHNGPCSGPYLGQVWNKGIILAEVKCEGLYLYFFMGGLH